MANYSDASDVLPFLQPLIDQLTEKLVHFPGGYTLNIEVDKTANTEEPKVTIALRKLS